MKRVSLTQKIILVVVLVAIVAVLAGGLLFRDYKLDFSSGMPTLVAKIQIPMVSGLSIDNREEKKLIVKCSDLGDSVAGYEFRISPFSNMWFAHSFRSEVPKKEIGKLKPGKQYYIQARCYKANPSGRTVNGQWGGVRGTRVKQETN